VRHLLQSFSGNFVISGRKLLVNKKFQSLQKKKFQSQNKKGSRMLVVKKKYHKIIKKTESS